MRLRLTDTVDKLLANMASSDSRMVVTGGGSAPEYRMFMSVLLPRVLEVSYMSDDATVAGIVRVARLLYMS